MLSLLISHSIIQDCEDALTNWVTANAAVSSKLSTRARTLSQRRHQKREGGVDLSNQDSSLKGDRDSWMPASGHIQYVDDDDEDDDEEPTTTTGGAANGESRGREEERVEAA